MGDWEAIKILSLVDGSRFFSEGEPANDSGIDDERQSDLGVPGREKIETPKSEFDEDSSPFVLSSNGGTVFGEVKHETGLLPAPIKLSLGNSKYGLVHLERRHGAQIRKAGFNSIPEFVEYVCKNYKRIRQVENSFGDSNGIYLIQIEDEHNNTLYLELSTDSSYWGGNSGGVFRKGYGNNKKEVWFASEEQNKQSATDNTLQVKDTSDNPITSNGTVSNASKESSLHPTTQIEVSVPLNDSNRPTTTDNQPAMLGINSSEQNVNKSPVESDGPLAEHSANAPGLLPTQGEKSNTSEGKVNDSVLDNTSERARKFRTAGCGS